MHNLAVLATIFPANVPYFSTFLKSLEAQTSQRFKLILANDGVADLETRITKLPFEIITAQGNPLAVRIQLAEYAFSRGFKKVVYADTDDTFSLNRVEVLDRLLDRYAVVCHDLDIMRADGELLLHGYWSGRIPDLTVIDAAFLATKNCVGFGSVGFTAEAFGLTRAFPNMEVPAPDWFFFYLLSHQCAIVFTTSCSTQYRQHPHNTIGAKQVTAERLKFILQSKLTHYEAFAAAGYPQQQAHAKVKGLANTLLANAQALEDAVRKLKDLNINYFWWEETNFLNG